MVRVTIWNEFWHERHEDVPAQLYPSGIHEFLREKLSCDDFAITTSWLDKDEEQGLSDELLQNTDVLIWWSHCKQDVLRDDVALRVARRAHDGMGFIGLHSARNGKPFRMMLGTDCSAVWRDWNEKTRVWCTSPAHPIAAGIPLSFDLEGEEMYGEHFDIPRPDDLVFVSWYAGGEIFRGGVTFTYGLGKIFYFHPGHERCRSFYNPHVIQIIKNAIYWANPVPKKDISGGRFVEPLEPIANAERK